MSGKGFTPRPNHLKALEGCREDRINREEPVPADLPVRPAVELSADAVKVWNRLAPDLIAKKVLTSWDVDLFTAFCNATAVYYRAAAEFSADEPLEVKGSRNQAALHPAFRMMEKAEAMMRATGQRFGLTPGDRAQLKVDDNGGAKQNAGRLIV